MKQEQDPPDSERRGFLRLLALVGMSSAVGVTSSVLAADPRGAGPPAAAVPDSGAAAAASQTPAEISDDARALAGILGRRHGGHLTSGQLEEVARELDGRLKSGERLRRAGLSNADEPDFTFRA